MAVAFLDSDDTVSVQVFNTQDPTKMFHETERMRFKLPKIELPPPVEKKETGCEYHKTESKKQPVEEVSEQ